MNAMDDLDQAALQLKAKFPRCGAAIDREVARLRNDAKAAAPSAVQEWAITLMQRVQALPCAQDDRTRKVGSKAGGRQFFRR